MEMHKTFMISKKHMFRKLRDLVILFKIYQSKLFNREYYLKNNTDVALINGSPLNHFINYGGFEGRNPSEKFDSTFYLDQNPDVKSSGMNPLVHYIKFGKKEGRNSLPKVKTLSIKDEYNKEEKTSESNYEIWESIYGDFELNKNYSHQNISGLDKESGWIRGEIVKTIQQIRTPVKTALLPGEHNGLKSIYSSLLNIPENKIKTSGLDNNVDFHWNFENEPPNFGKFSIIISQAMLEHLIDPYKHVRDLFEALEPGGHLILHTVIPGFIYHRHPIDCFRFFPDWFEEVAIRIDAIIADKYIGEERILYRYFKALS